MLLAAVLIAATNEASGSALSTRHSALYSRRHIMVGQRLSIIVVAVIWAVVILAISSVLADTPSAPRVLSILGGGAAATIILLGGMLRNGKAPCNN
jgi:hypothetical protein